MPSPTIVYTSIGERLLEIFRDQRARRLRRAHVGTDARSLAGNPRFAEGGRAIRVAAPCLAPGIVRSCHVHNRSVVNSPNHRTLSWHVAL